MADCVDVARLDEIPTGTGTVVTVAGKDAALFNGDGTSDAMEYSCLQDRQRVAALLMKRERTSAFGHS